nr:16S rRNA (uracil(1498)-N(3))-methyltransferase [uncultured Desulfuromonas sp.]
MSLECVNNGGSVSRIVSACALTLEQEAAIGLAGRDALSIWQARVGEIVTVEDPFQQCYRARITDLDDADATVVPFEMIDAVESPVQICLCQALPEKERFELVLQKMTEIGVNRIVPFISQHSTTVEERDAGQKKSHRWPDVLLRAGRQCRRAELPELMAVCDFDTMLESLSDWDVKLLLSEKGAAWSFREGIGSARPDRIAVIVGPEGGFADAEIEQAQGRGVVPVSVGRRILRTETAAIVAATLAQFCVGDYA